VRNPAIDSRPPVHAPLGQDGTTHPSAQEQQLYEAVAAFRTPHMRKDSKSSLSRMALLSLQMALGSSSPAAASTLGNWPRRRSC